MFNFRFNFQIGIPPDRADDTGASSCMNCALMTFRHENPELAMKAKEHRKLAPWTKPWHSVESRNQDPLEIEELWRARSLLYQRRFLRPNSHFSAFFEIYKIQNPLHRSKPKFSQNFRKTFFNFLSNFENFLSRECLILAWKMFNFSVCRCLILTLIFK